MNRPTSMILNSPYTRPTRHWKSLDDNRFEIVDERRTAGYEIIDTRNNTKRMEPLELVNQIRIRVDEWRAAGYPGVTSVSRVLLEHWQDRTARQYPFYFCQLEAIETLIWYVEAPTEHRQGIYIQGDGGPWERVCNKMATGSGKTILMAMIITWQVLNALTYPKRKRDFSRAVFIVAPGLTVKGRLQVLLTGNPDNVYDAFSLCPSESLRQKLNQAEILVENWHTLMPLQEQTRSVVKKGRESDLAFVKRVLGRLSDHKNILIINDEAHHAYRTTAEVKISKREAAERGQDLNEATRWIEGLDRIHRRLNILRCFDLSATPFAPTGKKSTEEGLYNWIVSDFGLNDAIESGLVKTPRLVIRDNALPNTDTYRSKLFHIYREPEVADDLNRKAKPHEPLPKLVQDAYTLLSADWRETKRAWDKAGHTSPPVMLTVCNRIETAARIEHYFENGHCLFSELTSPDQTLRVDSKVLDKAEIGEASSSDKQYEEKLRSIIAAAGLSIDVLDKLKNLKKEELLREIVDNVGKRGTAGQNLQKVISVAMLSEGWDAKNVTHIMGLRAFTSQLLCEQVIGRGLRRVSYEMDENDMFYPEYVNIFGVPLTVFQDATGEGEAPPPAKASIQIESIKEKAAYEISWPNVLRIETVLRPELVLNWQDIPEYIIDPATTAIRAEIAPAIGGALNGENIHTIDLSQLSEDFRLQRLSFLAAQKAFTELKHNFFGNREYLMIQLIRLLEKFIDSDRLVVKTKKHSEPATKRILAAMHLDAIVQHMLRYAREENKERVDIVYDTDKPQGSTSEMRTWYTTKFALLTTKSQISHAVADSSWEQYTAEILEKSDLVDAWAKNDHLGFYIYYLWKGSRARFIPDYLIRLKNGRTLILEIKGQDSDKNRAKREALAQWVEGVNARGGHGHWASAVAFQPAEVYDILDAQCDVVETVESMLSYIKDVWGNDSDAERFLFNLIHVARSTHADEVSLGQLRNSISDLEIKTVDHLSFWFSSGEKPLLRAIFKLKDLENDLEYFTLTEVSEALETKVLKKQGQEEGVTDFLEKLYPVFRFSHRMNTLIKGVN